MNHRSRISQLEKRSELRQSRAVTAEIPEDPLAFAAKLHVEPDPWQRELLTSTDNYIILNCARQSGKSTIVAILALHTALLHPGSLILILSPSQRQSGELLKKIIGFYRELGRPKHSRGEAITLQLGNGSRIAALPGSEATIRGFSSPSLILVDEAAQVDEELYYAVRPMLATSSERLILLGTPRGKQGVFWRAWNHESGWHKVKVTAAQCPRISKEFLERERRASGE